MEGRLRKSRAVGPRAEFPVVILSSTTIAVKIITLEIPPNHPANMKINII